MKILGKILWVLPAALLIVAGVLLLQYFPSSKYSVGCSILLVCMGILFITSYLLLSFSYFLQKTWVRVLFFCVLFCLGVFGYFTSASGELPRVQKLLLSICASLSEFFPSRGSYDVLGEGTFNWGLIGFCLLCYFFAISILIAIFGRKLTNKWQLFLTKLNCSERRVFWCDIPGDKEEMLADNIRGQHSDIRCIFSVKESAIEEEKIAELMANLNFKHDLLCLRKPGQFHIDTLKAPVHFFITDDCSWNIAMAQRVWQEIAKRKKKLIDKVDFYIRVSGGVKNYWAAQWAEKIQNIGSDKPELEIHLLQESELIARKFVRDNPLLTAPGIEIFPEKGKIKGNFKILLLGFGDLGEAILRETVCDGQFLHTDGSDSFSMDVIDYAPQSFNLFAVRCPEAVKQYHISFYEKDVYSSDFYKFMEDRIASYNRVIVAFYDRTLSMDIAAQIVELAKISGTDLQSKMFVNLPDAPADMKNSVFPEFTAFGSLQECYSEGIIIDEELDRNARKINSSYNKGIDNWSKLNLFAKDSNRSCAAGLYNLCRLMGMTDPEKMFNPNALEHVLANGLLDVYAETEHLRWNAFHFVRGIRKWDISGVTEKIVKANDIKAHLRHAALVDFNDLPLIDEKIGKGSNLKSNDRDIIIVMLKAVLGSKD